MKAVKSRDARRLLHVVGDDDDRVVGLQLVDQLLDLGGRDRIERRARLVEQDDLGLDRHGAGDAQPLLLAAGQAQAAGVELVLHLVPQRGARAARPRRGRRARTSAGSRRAGCRRRCCRRWSSGTASASGTPCRCAARSRLRSTLGRQDVLAVEQDLALGALVGIEVVHAVEDPQQRGLAAARGADEGGRPCWS